MSNLFRLNGSDLLKGLSVAVLGAVFAWGAQVLNAPGFDFASLQWDEVIKVAVVAGLSYLSKNWMTAENGKILGKIG